MAAGDLGQLFSALTTRGYQVIGPTVRDGAVVYDAVDGPDALAAGWGDEQAPGSYRLVRRRDGAIFGHRSGPTGWKRFFWPPELRLWQARRMEDGFRVEAEPAADPPRRALLGVRPCQLHGLLRLDRVVAGGPYPDPRYRAARERAFIVAVNCTEAGGTCFCASMGTGPAATAGYDLALTELVTDGAHRFLVEAGSEAGRAVLSGVPHRQAEKDEVAAARVLLQKAAEAMGRRLDAGGVKELLYEKFEADHWDRVAERCLACANCTSVCPTCFCTTVTDATDLAGGRAERRRRWDSCFSVDFSYIHGGPVRASVKSRYRQWLTHKLATWHDQFGTSGCVGCGQCITWCPVGIDLTAEVRALRAGGERGNGV